MRKRCCYRCQPRRISLYLVNTIYKITSEHKQSSALRCTQHVRLLLVIQVLKTRRLFQIFSAANLISPLWLQNDRAGICNIFSESMMHLLLENLILHAK